MSFAIRFGGYILGGGALLAWADPPAGPLRWIAILVYIVAAATLDSLIARPGRGTSRGDARGVVKLDAFRVNKGRKGAAGAGRGERRPPRPLHHTLHQGEAEDLLALLRAKGLNPIMVSRRTAGDGSPVMYEVRLPEAEMPRAKSLTTQYLARKSAPHS